ncbi:methyl-accepting chemotaxis protein [Novosphingobium pituita]|uniref:Methyl-accepting chemotaxis protein n=1 Tax=Novosphingobium pituita TaxID=3056842 RepID=A0ABQ6PAK9_9SPHN|nr:methyl-accepting chemotaxis protein [Novosphingobium sp. IK01]GMM62297.1 methyl-accepting chemotaxis protein [Novosphingobium sp. IK01]
MLKSFAMLRSVKGKIAVMAGACIVIAFAVLVAYSTFSTFRTHSYVNSRVSDMISGQVNENLQNRADAEARFIKSELDTAFDAARNMANSFEQMAAPGASGTPMGERRAQFNAVLRNVLEHNPRFNGTYSAWEPNGLDGNDGAHVNDTAMGSDATGRFLPYWTRAANGNIAIQPLVEYDSSARHPNGLVKGAWYINPHNTHRENLLGPLPYIVQGKQVYLATMSVPVMINGQFRGVAGADYNLDFLQTLANQVSKSLYGGKSTVAVINDSGLIVANSANPATIGGAASQANPAWANSASIIAAGKSVVLDDPKSENLQVYAPIRIGRVDASWAVLISVPRAMVMADAQLLSDQLGRRSGVDTLLQLVIGMGIAAVAIFMTWRMASSVAQPISGCAQFAEGIAQGNLNQQLAIEQADEVGTLAEALRKMQHDLRTSIERTTQDQASTRLVVDTVSKNLERLANGDLTAQIVENFSPEFADVKRHFNGAVSSLHRIMRSVEDSSRTISIGVGEINQASIDLANRTETGAARLEQTASAMNSVTAIVRKTAENAAEARRAIISTDQQAVDGGGVVRNAVTAMGEIERSASEINQIIGVIDGIAFQTNLLALNAGVEAARAGDAGKGFAVVASEVRSLAMRSAEAAQDIKNLINASSQQVTQGVTLVAETGSALEHIIEQIGGLRKTIDEIANSAEVQARDLAEINTVVSEMERMTQQNAAMVEESTAAARSLNDQARTLDSAIGRFNMGGGHQQSGFDRHAA